MIFLLLSIFCTALLILAFKLFDRYNIPVFQAIVYNYLSATACAFIFLPDKSSVLSGAVFSSPWLWLSLGLGSMFIFIFNLTSLTTVKYGVSTASVAMKLGLVFPVLLAFTIYGEEFNWIKLLGILFAFVAVILSSLKEEPKSPTHKSSFAILPIIVFVGSGACDSLTQYANKTYLANTGMEEFSLFLFVAASIAGTGVFIYQLIADKAMFNSRSLVGGILLGIANYFSFLFLLKALATISWGSSVVFPVSNLGTVLLASLAGVVLFKEKISKINLLGLAFAVLSIILIILSSGVVDSAKA
ncbi:MAG TPA: DMT family transporter [Chitinophagales bacterium]|nr:DMT family transporter [Chitinophagales bacterium]